MDYTYMTAAAAECHADHDSAKSNLIKGLHKEAEL